MGDVYRDMEYYLRITNHMISIGTSILDMPQDFVKTWVSARRENAGARLLKDYFEADSSHNPSVYIVDSGYRKDMRREIEKHNRSVEEDRKIKYLFVPMENGQTLLITRDRDEREMDQVMNNMKEKGIHEGVLSEDCGDLYEQKLLLGNPLQDYVENLLSNDEVEIDEYVHLNHMNEEYDLSEEIIKDVNERQARIKVQIEEQHDLDMEREDVYEMEIQEDREEIILSDDDRYLYDDRNGDGISDIYQDENANGIPDWQEEERE